MRFLIIISFLLYGCIFGTDSSLYNIEGEWINEKEEIEVTDYNIHGFFRDQHNGEAKLGWKWRGYSYMRDTLTIFYGYKTVKYWRK